MSKSTPCISSTAAAVAVAVALMAACTLLVMAPPASAARPAVETDGRCDPLRDIQVNQTAGALQLDGSKEFDVVVTNQGRAVVSDVHLYCSYLFRFVGNVDPNLLVQAKAGDGCLLIDGGAIAPGGTVSFSYASYTRYSMAVVSGTCSGR